ncbi:hypothetical protein [Gluconacetobacter takamatsuzukensis]|uniref:Transmembrane protein (PGPGW) n=1 Tax=Gluconacetobacter takamatsuzukensis TaxID=1286190 RepID=A0A7W4KDE0_9PROT|nr:hypothetical protein [Gluconacetobacter takamatsuzukensis]MBB2204887.1 hypothetical protein [Gluconacetobacter takamatsuzukensis]
MRIVNDPKDEHDRLVHMALARVPARLRDAIHWLRVPSRRLPRLLAGCLLIVGGLLSFLPILGIWMLPLGLILLAEDVALLRRGVDRLITRIAQRHPGWLTPSK